MMVPTGMLRASSATGIGEAVLTLTSAMLLEPIGVGGTATPFTVTNRRVGTLIGKGTWYGVPSDADGVEVPVKLCVKASMRIRPTEPFGEPPILPPSVVSVPVPETVQPIAMTAEIAVPLSRFP